MRRLWAPWRYSYVTGSSSGESCVLCRIGASPGEDADNFVLTRTASLFVLLNRYPYINGHLMVVPFRHVPDLSSLEPGERAEMMEMLAVCEKALSDSLHCQGMNGGWNLGACAGAGIPGHVHMHVLPRWSGDVNFMSTIAGSRVLSASLEQSYQSLLPHFRGDGGE
jgi:ATP adenylyltransferase